MSISALIGSAVTRINQGGGKLYLVEYDSTKDPYQPHATIKADIAATATSLTAYRAPTADTNVPTSFGSTGTLDIDIFAESATSESKAYSALAANVFTISALTTARKKGQILKKNAAGDYTLTDWKSLGELDESGSGFKDTTELNKVYNEQGNLVATFKGKRDIELVPVMLQTGKEEYDFLLKEAPDKFFALKYVVPLVTGLGSQFIVARLARVIATVDVKFSANEKRMIPITLAILKDGSNDSWVIYEG